MASEYLEHKLALLPGLPGCYLMKNINSQIIYVGKAKNLKNRVRSYFKSSHTGKTAQLVSEIVDFETIITSTDKEAFLLEITLIQKHQPYFNIKLKRGTGYPYIKITNERDPQLLLVSDIKKDGAYYFGPYPNVYAAEETIHFLQKVYPLRRCTGYQGAAVSVLSHGTVSRRLLQGGSPSRLRRTDQENQILLKWKRWSRRKEIIRPNDGGGR